MPSACTTLSSDRPVARVLRDLAPPELAFLRQPLEIRATTTVSSCRMIDALMYGMMPSAKIVDLRQARRRRTCRHRPNIAVLAICRASSSSAAVLTPGVVMRAPSAVHAEQPEREQHAVAQLRNGEDVLQAVRHIDPGIMPLIPTSRSECFRLSRRRPAIFSAALPLNLCARTVSALPDLAAARAPSPGCRRPAPARARGAAPA